MKRIWHGVAFPVRIAVDAADSRRPLIDRCGERNDNQIGCQKETVEIEKQGPIAHSERLHKTLVLRQITDGKAMARRLQSSDVRLRPLLKWGLTFDSLDHDTGVKIDHPA